MHYKSVSTDSFANYEKRLLYFPRAERTKKKEWLYSHSSIKPEVFIIRTGIQWPAMTERARNWIGMQSTVPYQSPRVCPIPYCISGSTCQACQRPDGNGRRHPPSLFRQKPSHAPWPYTWLQYLPSPAFRPVRCRHHLAAYSGVPSALAMAADSITMFPASSTGMSSG